MKELINIGKLAGALLCLSLLPSVSSAQSPYDDPRIIEFPDRIDIDTAQVEVVYDVLRTDPLNEGRQEGDRMVLQIGSRYSKFTDYPNLQEMLTLRKENYKVTHGRWRFISDSVGVVATPRALYIDRQSNKCRESGYAWSIYSYDEEMPEIDWELTGEAKEIGGYACRSAECDFRGRHWSVWYSPEIKISAGPYKLMGLPGLILEAHSRDGEMDVTFVAFGKSDDPIVYDKKWYEDSFKGSRKDFYRAISRGKWNSSQAMESAGLGATDMEGNPLKPMYKYMFYVPWELDLVERPKE